MTYGTLSYAYFVLAKSFDIRRKRENVHKVLIHSKQSGLTEVSKLCDVSTTDGNKIKPKDSVHTKLQNGCMDKECHACEEYHELDRLFPERMCYGSMEGSHPGIFIF